MREGACPGCGYDPGRHHGIRYGECGGGAIPRKHSSSERSHFPAEPVRGSIAVTEHRGWLVGLAGFHSRWAGQMTAAGWHSMAFNGMAWRSMAGLAGLAGLDIACLAMEANKASRGKKKKEKDGERARAGREPGWRLPALIRTRLAHLLPFFAPPPPPPPTHHFPP